MKTDPDKNDAANPDVVTPPFISIIIPTRNRPDLLIRALQSIQKQSYASYEVIVIDDASDQDTRHAYEEWQDSLGLRFRFEYIGSTGQKGLGPSVTRNRGIAVSTGDIIAFCDDDDFWTDENHLAMMAHVFSSMPNVDMYIANQSAVSCSGVVKSDWLPALNKITGSRPQIHQAGYLVSVDDLCRSGGFAHLNILSLRKVICGQIDGFWDRLTYEEDRDFFWRALDRCNQIMFNPNIIGQHNIPDPNRQNNQSTKHSMVERWMLSVLVCQHITTSVENGKILALTHRYEGDLLRLLSRHFSANKRPTLGLQFARRALAARFSFKWAGYMSWLMIEKLVNK